jgi:hypothetical protein
MALVVLMERCNFVSAGAESIDCTEATGTFHFTGNMPRGSALILLKRASWSAVKKVDCRAYNWRFLLLDIAFGCRSSKKFPAKKLRIFSVKNPRLI